MRLFLYGTLQPVANTKMSRWLAPKLQGAVAATVSGRLVAVSASGGWYPALLTGSGTGRCHGTVATALLDADDWALIDRYEGHEYRRAAVEVVTSRAEVVSATSYLWRGKAPPGAQDIATGDFLAWLAQHDRAAFGSGG